jgi:hypothetical protein
MSNLALAYLEAGKIDAAMELSGKVLEQSHLGEKHPSTLTWMANIAGGFAQMGSFEVAEELGQKVLSASAEVLGEDHPDTILCMSNLAMTYRGQAKKNQSSPGMAAAAEMMIEVIRRGTSRLGPEHLTVLISTYNLALIRLEEGKREIAQDVWGRIVGKMEKGLWPSHECTVRCKRYLAIMDGASEPRD